MHFINLSGYLAASVQIKPVDQRPLKVIETDAIQKLVCSLLFAFHSNYGRICSHFGDIHRQRMAWAWKHGYGSFKVIGNDTIW